METIFEGLKIAFFGVLMFSIIVTIHEAGHFTAARLFGLRVKEFMLGLPGPNIGVNFKGTKFGVTPILLGGYALIAGEGSEKENPNLASAYAFLSEHGKLDEDRVRGFSTSLGYDLEDALDILDAWGTIKRSKENGRYHYSMLADTCAKAAFGEPRVVEDAPAHIAAERKLTFNAAPWYQRVIILAAGVIFNLVFAIVVITAFYMISGAQVPSTTMQSIVEESPAAAAGMLVGDRVVAFDGKTVDSWEALATYIAEEKPGNVVELDVERSGATKNLTLKLGDNNGTSFLGVSPAFEKRSIGFVEAFSVSVGYIGLVVEFILKLFNPATTGEVVSQSSSVIGVSFIAKDAAESGFLPFIAVSAMLSISIGLMNLLPFPPLDGGRIVVETIERITRRRIPLRIISAITMVALGLLILLFVVVMWQDIQRFIIGG